MKSAVLAIAAALTAFPQPPASQFRSNSRLVQLNVVVRDHNGPVAGLKKEDFTVTDAKTLRPISLFEVETSSTVIPGAMPQLQPNVFVNSLQRHAATPANISVILFDGLNTPVTDLPYARRQLSRFLSTLKPDDAVAIYSMGRTVQVLHDFTSEPRNLANLISAGAGDSLLTNLDRRDAAINLESRIRLTTEALEAVAQHVSPLPGRKNLIWISAAFPLSGDHASTYDSLARASRALNAANVSLYPIDARGLMVAPPSGETQAIADPQAAMTELAERTGGRAFYAGNDIAGSVRRAIEDTTLTYVLGFYPEDSALDGQYHELTVQIPARKGLDIRARRGYFATDRKPLADAATREVAARAAAAPLQASQIEIAVHVARPEKGSLLLELLISARELTLTQHDDRYQGGIKLSIVQLGKNKKVLDIVTDPVALNLKQDKLPEYLETGMSMARTVKEKPGLAEIRVIAVDRPSGIYGSVIIPTTSLQ